MSLVVPAMYHGVKQICLTPFFVSGRFDYSDGLRYYFNQAQQVQKEVKTEVLLP